MQITASNIGDEVANAVRSMIVQGDLLDGERINEVRLAEELGVSRTPLRDGLTLLITDGVVTRAPKRGFFVAPMTLAEFEQVYAIRPLLDPEALRLAGLPSASRLAELRDVNQRFQAATSPTEAIDLDDQWHLLLLADCPNAVLVELITNLIGRTRRYEHALFRETENVWAAGDEHERILDALAEGQLRAACRLLRQNMRSGAGPIREWLSAREQS